MLLQKTPAGNLSSIVRPAIPPKPNLSWAFANIRYHELSITYQSLFHPELSKKLNWGRFLVTNKLSTDYMYYIIDYVGSFPIYRAKQRIITSVNRFLVNMGMETSNAFILKTYQSIQQPALKRWVDQSIDYLPSNYIHFKRFLRNRTRIVTIPFESWNLRLVNVQRKLKSHFWDLNAENLYQKKGLHQETIAPNMFRSPPGLEPLERCVPALVPSGSAGTHLPPGRQSESPVEFSNLFSNLFSRLTPNHTNRGWPSDPPALPSFFRVYGNSKTPRRSHFNDQAFDQNRFCQRWLKSTGIHFFSPPSPVVQPFSRSTNVGTEPLQSDQIISNFLFVEGLRDAFVTVEDKGPSVLWVCTDTSLVKHWFLQLLLVPTRWEVLALDPGSVLTSYRNILNRILPRSLLPRNKNFNASHIPYAYCTVKKKCFRNCFELTPTGFVFRGEGNGLAPAGFSPLAAHTCGKPNHSCLRSIVSFKKVPGRSTFKKVGRAIQQFMSIAFPTKFSLCDLSRARAELLSHLSAQAPRLPSGPGQTCRLRCRHAAPYPSHG